MITIKLPTIIKLEEKNVSFLELTLKNYEVLTKLNVIFRRNNVRVVFNMVLKENSQLKSFYVLLFEKDLEKVIEEVKGVDGVIGMNYGVKNVENYVISPFTVTVNIALMNEKAVLIPSKSLMGSLRALRKHWGLASLVFLYHLGFNYGAILARKFLGNRLSNEKTLIVTLEFLKHTGMFKDYDLVMFDSERGNIVLHVYGSIECSSSLEEKVSSHFLRGIIGGVVSEIVGKEVTVYETKCIARGDRYCEFIS